MNWKIIKYFKRTEFAEDGELGAPTLIQNLDTSRALVGKRMYPSPVIGSFARFGGSKTSQHYIGEDPSNIVRKTTAVDMFIEGVPMENFVILQRLSLFNGIGVYLDTTGPDGLPWVMFHLDVREMGHKGPQFLTWFGIKVMDSSTGKVKTVYRYPQSDSKYWGLFSDGRLYRYKKKGVA